MNRCVKKNICRKCMQKTLLMKLGYMVLTYFISHELGLDTAKMCFEPSPWVQLAQLVKYWSSLCTTK